MAPGRRGNRRIYRQADVNALADVVRLKSMGLAICDICAVMQMVASGDAAGARAELLRLARIRLEEIRKEMARLEKASGYAQSAVERISFGEPWFESL